MTSPQRPPRGMQSVAVPPPQKAEVAALSSALRELAQADQQARAQRARDVRLLDQSCGRDEGMTQVCAAASRSSPR